MKLAGLIALATAETVSANVPLVLVPGLTGSALEVQMSHAPMPHFECDTDTHGKWKTVWLDPTAVLPREIDCLLTRMTLTYDAATDTYSNLPGIKLRPHVGMDLLYKYEFGDMIDGLKASLNYELDKDLFLAPYDWRLAGDAHTKEKNGVGGYYAQLQTTIEESVKSTGKKAVVLSHSLGCPTMLYFFHHYVSEEWRAANIKGWVAVSGPWLGSTMQANAYLGGYTMGMPSWLLPHDYVKKVQVNATSGVWLSPHSLAFGDAPIVTTPTHNYTAADIPKLISMVGEEAGGAQTIALHKKFANDLTTIQRPPVNVPVLNWYSTGVKTSERYEYDREITEGFNRAPKKIHYGDGDGIVNHISALVVEHRWPQVPSAPVSTKVFPNASHFGMLSDKRVLQALTEYLGGRKQNEEVIV